MTSNQIAQMQYIKIRHWQSKIASKSIPNRGTAGKNTISRGIKNTYGKNYEIEKVMKFLKELENILKFE